MRALLESIESCLTPLQMVAKTRLSATTKNGQKLLSHFLASYVADLSNTEDLLAVNRGSQIFTPSRISYTKREEFPYSTSAEL